MSTPKGIYLPELRTREKWWGDSLSLKGTWGPYFLFFLLSFCVCIYTYMYMLICVQWRTYIYVPVHTKARRQPQLLFSRSHPPCMLRQSLSLTWNSPSRVGWLVMSARDSPTPVSTSPALGSLDSLGSLELHCHVLLLPVGYRDPIWIFIPMCKCIYWALSLAPRPLLCFQCTVRWKTLFIKSLKLSQHTMGWN